MPEGRSRSMEETPRELFHFRTRGMTDPRGKARVLFACHPDDFDRYFEDIAGQVLKRQNCAVWYMDPREAADGVPAGDAGDESLDSFPAQLVVIPVTRKLLTEDNYAVSDVIPHAEKSRIPVLPVMEEEGLDDLFEEIFGDLQYLSPLDEDTAAVPYEAKLTNYLSEILVEDQTAAQVRESFDSYIFLSYRKKDRKYARSLMRIVHRDPRFQNTAIWYDEYLVPGENFNDEISAALKKSSVFMMAVTPNLLEKPNYVMSQEYPMALKEGKKILPVQMVKVPEDRLRQGYRGITKPVQPDTAAIGEILLEGRQSTPILPEKMSPKRKYYLGLAYLNGIDVEVHLGRAVRLITQAADAGCEEALRRITVMYREGQGVERREEAFIEWQGKLTALLERRFRRERTERTFDAYMLELFHLGIALKNADRLPEAKSCFQKAERAASGTGFRTAKTALANSWIELGDIIRDEGDPEGAQVYFRKARAAEQKVTAGSRKTDAADAYSNQANNDIKSGEAALEAGKVREAREAFERALQNAQRAVSISSGRNARTALALSLLGLGDVCKAGGQLKEAEENYRKALKIGQATEDETAAWELSHNVAIIYDKIGYVLQAERRFAEAEACFLQALEIRQKMAAGSDQVIFQEALTVSYTNLGNNAQLQKRMDAADAYFRKKLEIVQKLSGRSGSVRERHNLMISYMALGDDARMAGRLQEAFDHYQQALPICRDLAENTKAVGAARDLVSVLQRMALLEEKFGHIERARDLYGEAGQRLGSIAESFGFADDYVYAAQIFGCLADLELKTGDPEAERKARLESLRLLDQVLPKTDSGSALLMMGLSAHRLGQNLENAGRKEEAAACYRKALQGYRAADGRHGIEDLKPAMRQALMSLSQIEMSQGHASEAARLRREAEGL